MRSGGLLTLAAAGLLGFAAWTLVAPAAAAASSDRRVQVGDPVDDAELPTLDGRRDRLLGRSAKASVLVFFRPQQERSLDTLRDLASCEKELASKPVRFVGIVSDSWPAEEVRAFVRQAGAGMTILVDEGDALYGKLGIRLHPVVAVVDARKRLAAFEPFRQINYCERVRIRIKLALGEATEADVARVDEPERATTRTDDGVARRHLNFARMLHKVGKHDEALSEIDRSLATRPAAAAHVLRGEILAAAGRCPEALRAFDAALALEPDNVAARDGRGRCGR